jgi:hypothetical protein
MSRRTFDVSLARVLRGQQMSYRKIAARVGVNESSVRRALKSDAPMLVPSYSRPPRKRRVTILIFEEII